jgi:TatD DNase family protein
MNEEKEVEYFDIHAHMNFAVFDTDREEVIRRAGEASVGIINVGTQIETSQKALELAEKYENMYAIVGLHPIHTCNAEHDENEIGSETKPFVSKDNDFDEVAYEEMCKHPKVVAIGECGLDFYRLDEHSIERQKKIFIQHLELAQKVGKPVMLHIRSNKDRSAYAEALEILKKYPEVKGDVHFFAGSLDDAQQFIELGYTLSFTGAITYPKTDNYREVIEWAPLDMIMAETDCPYVAPVPNRGTRNEPVYVIEVYKKIAEIKGFPVDLVAAQLRENVRRVFRI